MFTREEQMNIIKEAKYNKEKALKLIEKANIFYEKDRNNFNDIIETKTIEGTINIYDNLDTAARDKLIEILAK